MPRARGPEVGGLFFNGFCALVRLFQLLLSLARAIPQRIERRGRLFLHLLGLALGVCAHLGLHRHLLFQFLHLLVRRESRRLVRCEVRLETRFVERQRLGGVGQLLVLGAEALELCFARRGIRHGTVPPGHATVAALR